MSELFYLDLCGVIGRLLQIKRCDILKNFTLRLLCPDQQKADKAFPLNRFRP